MFKRQAHVHTKLAAAIVSALFLSLSAHAGLLGAGGVATGVTSSVVGGMNGRLGVGTPMPATAANAATAAQVTGQTRVQGAIPAPNAAGTVQQTGQAGAQVSSQVSGQVTGQVTGREAAVVSTSEDITQQAERLTRKGRATGTLVVEQATDAQGQASGQAIRIKQSGEADAQAQVTTARTEAGALGAQATGTVAATQAAAQAAASRKPQVSAKGSVSGSGSLQASSRNTSLSGDTTVRGAAAVTN